MKGFENLNPSVPRDLQEMLPHLLRRDFQLSLHPDAGSEEEQIGK